MICFDHLSSHVDLHRAIRLFQPKDVRRFVNLPHALKSLLRPVATPVLAEFHARFGSRRHRRRFRGDQTIRMTMKDAVLRLGEQHVPGEAGASREEPIFILSAGWRSGSTLLQRLMMARGEALIWGEPFSREGLVEDLARPLMPFSLGMSPDHRFVDKTIPIKDYSKDWIPTLAPHAMDLRAAYAEFFARLYAVSAREMGATRWGFKDVRLGAADAWFLRWIFPRSRIIFLYRNPYDCYNSFRGSYFHHRWPGEAVFSPARFGAYWANLLGPMLDDAGELGARVISYEALIAEGFDFAALEDFLGLSLDQTLLRRKVGSSGNEKSRIPSAELRVLRRHVEPLASRLGYHE